MYKAEPSTKLEKAIVKLSQEGRINDFFLTEDGVICFKMDGDLNYTNAAVTYEELFEMAKKCNAYGMEKGREVIVAGDYGLTLSTHRYRCNFLKTLGKWRFVLRLLPAVIPDPREVGIPEHIVQRFMNLKDGLVLLCGPTGSGKSTTIASLLYYRAKRKREHVLTLEDPMEFFFPDETASLITQREVGSDVDGFAAGLKTALRQAPNVIMVGEIRDPLTAEAALQLSETGHVVVSTLHTTSADMTVQRFMKLIPADRAAAAQSTLADALKIIMCQRLLPRFESKGRVAIHEILVHTSGIAAMIRNGNFTGIKQEMDTGSKYGHLTWMRSVEEKIALGILDPKWLEEYDTSGKMDKDYRELTESDGSEQPLDRRQY